MTRSMLCGLLALVCVGAIGAVPIACQSGGVGDPCTPEDEYDTQFPGFKIAQENIESRSFQCSTRICLVNHFQGRVSCPFGQGPNLIKSCNGPDDKNTCAQGESCVQSQVFAPECCDAADDACASACPEGLQCDVKRRICGCTQGTTLNGIAYFCDTSDTTSGSNLGTLKSYVCHAPGNCQSSTSEVDDVKNATQQCCVPGTDTPVSVSVCGQCQAESQRNADKAVYCSCRCCPKCCKGLPDGGTGEPCETDEKACGEACDPNFNFCSCPNGFTCTSIRPNVGLGDAQLTGAYCIKDGSAFTNTGKCGIIKGGYQGTGDCML